MKHESTGHACSDGWRSGRIVTYLLVLLFACMGVPVYLWGQRPESPAEEAACTAKVRIPLPVADKASAKREILTPASIERAMRKTEGLSQDDAPEPERSRPAGSRAARRHGDNPQEGGPAAGAASGHYLFGCRGRRAQRATGQRVGPTIRPGPAGPARGGRRKVTRRRPAGGRLRPEEALRGPGRIRCVSGQLLPRQSRESDVGIRRSLLDQNRTPKAPRRKTPRR